MDNENDYNIDIKYKFTCYYVGVTAIKTRVPCALANCFIKFNRAPERGFHTK